MSGSTETTFTRIASGLTLPFPALPTLACASLDDHLHLLALADPAPRKVLHLRLNRDGHPDGHPSELPLSYVGGVTACAETLVATGKTSDGDQFTVLGLDPQGAVLWQSAIPDVLANGALIVWPQPLCLNDQPAVFWATGGQTPTLWLAHITNGQCGTPTRLAPASPTGELAVTASKNGLVVLQKLQDLARLELVSVVDSQVDRQIVDSTDSPTAPAIAFLEDHYVLLWIAANVGEIRMQHFDQALKPLAAPTVVVQVKRPARPRSVRLIVGDQGHAAIIYTTASPILGPAISHGSHAPTSRAPSQEIAGFVAAYDPERNTVGDLQPLTDPPVSYEGAGWAADRLIVIGGSDGARLSVFG